MTLRVANQYGGAKEPGYKFTPLSIIFSILRSGRRVKAHLRQADRRGELPEQLTEKSMRACGAAHLTTQARLRTRVEAAVSKARYCCACFTVLLLIYIAITVAFFTNIIPRPKGRSIGAKYALKNFTCVPTPEYPTVNTCMFKKKPFWMKSRGGLTNKTAQVCYRENNRCAPPSFPVDMKYKVDVFEPVKCKQAPQRKAVYVRILHCFPDVDGRSWWYFGCFLSMWFMHWGYTAAFPPNRRVCVHESTANPGERTVYVDETTTNLTTYVRSAISRSIRTIFGANRAVELQWMLCARSILRLSSPHPKMPRSASQEGGGNIERHGGIGS